MKLHGLRKGDPITVVNPWNNQAFQHNVTAVLPDGDVTYRTSRELRMLIGVEGVDWIRGHHAQDSESICALLAVQLLRA